MAEMKKYLDTIGLSALVDNIKAEDAKVLAAAKDYTDKAPFDPAGTAQTKADAALVSAKEYTDALANGQVKANKEAIEKLNGADTVEGSVAKAVKDAKDALQANIDAVDGKADANAEAIALINDGTNGILVQAKAYADGKDASIEAAQKAGDDAQDAVDALAEKVGSVPEGKTVMGIITAIEEAAYDDSELRGMITDLTNNKADKTQVATDIADAVKAEEDARKEAVKGVQDAVDELAGTHADDKEELEGKIALKADQTALNAVSDVANAAVKQSDYDAKVEALEAEDSRIVGLVSAEETRATGVEESLQTQINTIMNNPDAEGAINSINEFTQYVKDHGTIAEGFRTDIDKNKDDIAAEVKRAGEAESALSGRLDTLEAIDHEAYVGADTALKTELEGKINGKVAQGDFDAVEERVEVLEGEMDGVQAAVATKAEAQALTDAVSALEGADADLDERLQLVEAQLGDGENSVSELIEEARQSAISVAAEDATTKAGQALTDAKAYTDAEVLKDRARLEALEAIDHEHSNKEVLDGITAAKVGNWDEAYTKAHEHSNKSVLDGITAENITTWNTVTSKAAQSDLDTAVGRIAANEGAITTINGTLADKADSDDLDAAVERIAKNETDIAALTSSVNSFTIITKEEVDALFA